MGALSTTELVIAFVAVGVGACIQGSLGFGLGLVAAPVLVIIDPSLVPGAILAIGVPLTYLIAWRERRSLDVREVTWAIVGRVVGVVIGVGVVMVLSDRWLAGLFACAVLLGVVLSVVGFGVEPTRPALFVAGLGSGVMGTATGVGGPPMALLLQRAQGPALRASLGAFMAIGATISLVALVSAGQFHRDEFRTIVVLTPAVLVGFWISRWTNQYLDRGHTRTAVLTFAALSAVSILLRDVF